MINLRNANPREDKIVPYTSSWFGSDTEQHFTLNLETNSDRMAVNGWYTLSNNEYSLSAKNRSTLNSAPLDYSINEFGFRSAPMPPNQLPRSIIALGDSNTLGVGMMDSIIWPTLVGNALRYRAINLGTLDGSLDSCYRLLFAWLPLIRSEYVFMLEPAKPRFENLFSGKSEQLANAQQNWVIHRDKTLRAMQNLCDQWNAKFFFISFGQCTEDGNIHIWNDNGEMDLARDLIHPGRRCHNYITYRLLRETGFKWDLENDD